MVDIVCEQLNPHACKTYLIGVKGAKEAVLIDPVIEHINDYVRLLEERELTLSMVIDTHIPIDKLGSHLVELEQYKDRDIVTVCRSWRRAHRAAQILKTAGFPKVAVLEGGMLAWKGLPSK